MEKIVVYIDMDLEDMIPGYIQNRWKDIDLVRAALEKGEFEAIRIIGHSMKGSGGGYGFDSITEFGYRLEMAAKVYDVEEITDAVNALIDYLNGLEIVYAENADE